MIILSKLRGNLRHLSRVFVQVLLLVSLVLAGCKKKEETVVPDKFNSLSTEEKMDYLMKTLPPDSVALFICEAAMGKKYDSRLELADALIYAYSNYKEADQVVFDDAFNRYGEELPLAEKVKFYKLVNLDDPEIYEYEIGLRYVGTIREEDKDAKKVKEELDNFKKECKTSPETYKRFMKGFKEALNLDRGHDLDEKIYTQFITYPDSI